MKRQRNKNGAGIAAVVWKTRNILPIVNVVSIMAVLSCAGTYNPEHQPAGMPHAAHLLTDSLTTFQAAGDAVFSLQGERHRTQVVVELKNSTDFSCDIYGPFMQPIVSLITYADSVRIGMDEKEYRYGMNDPITNIPFFSNYPIIFSDIVRILTGRAIRKDVIFSTPLRKEYKGRRIIYYWESDSQVVQMVFVHGGKEVRTIRYEAVGARPWKLDCSFFEDGLYKEIYFRADENNYFSLHYDHIKSMCSIPR